MSEFKGTPGPWRVSEKRGDLIDIRHQNNEPGAMSLNLAHVVSRLSWLKEAEANAQLIAAAPELLKELQLLVACVIDLENYYDFSADVIVEDAQAAIAKALGETK